VAASAGKLNVLQTRVLETLAALEPHFILSGGGALAGVHLAHRTTRDLDLFWRNREQLGDLGDRVERALTAAGFVVTVVQRSLAFVQLRVASGEDVAVVDLIAEPAGSIETPEQHAIGAARILVDSPAAILAEKLCALLERAEIRDLVDIEALVQRGERLDRAIENAPRRDSGFSPLTLAWVLRDLNVRDLAKAAGFAEEDAQRIDEFRAKLMDALI
jgi:predicted nucleotidyltransferase component of viral defense system